MTTAETRIVDSSEVKVTVKAAVLVEEGPEPPEPVKSQDKSSVEEGETASFVGGTVRVLSRCLTLLVPYHDWDGSALAGARQGLHGEQRHADLRCHGDQQDDRDSDPGTTN